MSKTNIVLLTCWLLLLVSVHGIPFLDNDNISRQQNMLSLTGGIKLSWHIATDGYLTMNVVMPHQYTWSVVGFHKMEYESSPSEDLAFIHPRKRNKIKIYIRTLTFNSVGDIIKSPRNVYIKSNQKISVDQYELTLERDLGDLPYGQPVKLIWAYGDENGAAIFNDFKSKLHEAVVTLNDPTSLKLLQPTTTPQPVDVNSIGISNESGPVKSSPEATEIPSATEVPLATKIPLSTESSTLANESSEVMPVIDEKSNIKTISTVLVNGTTPCPTKKCNCPGAGHWYENITNSLYMAIIGASALFTGMLTLCVACCCARKTSRLPKVRKHKVAFYKVDDFDSDAEEEIEFLREEKAKASS
ncbi:uncharacterized protein LOC130655847 [Hydractinia symbiolongicarpus]|uniref:uncharacterized protein LOC130655847 n=1 Tax=Hydractinia symbiolongicarpus TaxID=13093 RepID=UPI00254B54C5|nr:uncharacterized protein LOC130655847 [Hydractinia symbiolongicarpus]